MPKLTREELMERNRRAIARLDAWERDGDLEEQTRAMEALKRVLGPDREMGYRSQFP
jgi:hypothetical protein